MNLDKLKREIINLIHSKREGDYWDFKQKYHTNNSDLLHDIICMANNRADRDGYIIFGVTDAEFEIVGVKNDENRKNQQQIIDFLKDKKFAGGIRPTIELKTLDIENHEIDILVIKNTTDTPYYMGESFKGIMSNYIYTRIGDTNTPKNRSADINHVEYLWKKRFLLNRPPLQQILGKLKNKKEWKSQDGIYYYIYNPQFKICFVEEENSRKIIDTYNYAMKNETIKRGILKVKHYETNVYSTESLSFRDNLIILPKPEVEILRFEDNNSEYMFKYLIEDSIGFKISKFLGEEDNSSTKEVYEMFSKFILEFNTGLEKDNFTEHIKKKRAKLDRLILEDQTYYDFSHIHFKNSKDKVENELKIGVALKKMLKDFRKEFYK